MSKRLLLFLVPLLILSGCGGAPTQSTLNYDGDWQATCNFDSQTLVYYSDMLRIQSDRFYRTRIEYSDAACSLMTTTYGSQGTIISHGTKILSSGVEANKVTISYTWMGTNYLYSDIMYWDPAWSELYFGITTNLDWEGYPNDYDWANPYTISNTTPTNQPLM